MEPPSARGPGRPAPKLPAFGLGAHVGGVDLATLGAVLAALALLALLASIFAVIADFLVGPGTHVAVLVEDVLHLIASVCGLVGGLRLLQRREDGRGLVYWSLGINLVSTLLLGGSQLRQAWTWVNLVTWVVLAVLVASARQRGRYRFF